MAIKEAKKALSEIVSMYLQKDSNGEYCIPENR